MPYVRLLLSPLRPHDVKVLPSVQCGQVQPGSCSCAAALRSPFVSHSIRNLSTLRFRNRNKAKAKYKIQKKKYYKKKVNLPCGNLHFNCHLTRTHSHRTASAIFFTAAVPLLLRCCVGALFIVYVFRVLSPQKVKK